MTTQAQPVSRPLAPAHPSAEPGTLVRRTSGLIRRLARPLAAIAFAAQLGPITETEIGRTTGSRV